MARVEAASKTVPNPADTLDPDDPLYPPDDDGLPTDNEAQGKEPAVIVEVVDDVPAEDQRARPAGDRTNLDDPALDEEVKTFSEGAQKRIGLLRYEYHEQRRLADAAQRTTDAATEYAQKVAHDNEALKKSLDKTNKLLGEQFDAKADSDLAVANQAFKEAFEAGDTDGVVNAQSNISRIQAEKVAGLRRADVAELRVPENNPAVVPASVGVPDARAMGWIRDNPWFHKPGSEDMTGFAIGLHEKLVLRDHLDPRVHSEYYARIDEGLRNAFPDYGFISSSEDQGRNGNQPPAATPKKSAAAAPVAGPTRGGKRTPRTVRLTPTQVALAKRLGLTREQYAMQVAKEATQNG